MINMPKKKGGLGMTAAAWTDSVAMGLLSASSVLSSLSVLSNLLVLSGVLVLSGCGASHMPEDGTDGVTALVQDTGQLQIALTDAEGDFLSYTVNVQSIVLTKESGAEVETVPLSTRVDFAEYTEMTEFFNIATLPAGVYVSAALNLDYSHSDIIVQDENGLAHQAAAQDTNGDTITTMKVSVQLDEGEPIIIKRGVPASLSLDFDLEASNTIESFDPAIVTVEPFILTEVQLDRDREHRARGLLTSVDLALSQFTARLRPFYRRSGEYGEVTVRSNSETHYEINGEQFIGERGLAKMDSLALETPVITFGHIVEPENDKPNMIADRVHAGTSVPWVGHDAIRGVVIAREGDRLTVRGRHWDRENHSASFNDNIIVTLSESTKVTQQALSNVGLSKESISVGQRLIAFGNISDETADNLLLDASEGHIRMMMNLITGVVVSAEPLALDMRYLNGRRPNVFDFSGTGAESSSDADIDHYEIDTSSLVLENIGINDLVKVRGFVTPFGSAPEDYDAQTVIEINVEQRAGVLKVYWQGGSSEPFVSIDEELLVLNMDSANYKLNLAGVPELIAPELTNISIAPIGVAADRISRVGRGVFSIKERGNGSIRVYTNFAHFIEGLSVKLSEGMLLVGLLSDGRMDSETGVMYAVNVNAVFDVSSAELVVSSR